MQPRPALAHLIVPDGDDPVVPEGRQPALPRRLAREEQGSKSLQFVEPPPGLLPVRILQGHERNLLPIVLEERLTVGEVGIAEVERADTGIAAPLKRVVEVQPRELLVLAELPDQPAAGLVQRSQASAAKLLPCNSLAAGQRRAEVHAGRHHNIARVAVRAQARHIDKGAVLLVGDEELHGNLALIGDTLGLGDPTRYRVLGAPQVDAQRAGQLDRLDATAPAVGLDLDGEDLEVLREFRPRLRASSTHVRRK